MTNVNEDQNGWQVVNRLCPRRPNSKHSVSKRKDATHPASIKSLIPEKKTGEESHRVHKFTDIKLTPPDTPPHNQNESPVVSGDEIFSSCLETDDINEDIFHDDPYETILVSWKKLSELRPVKWLQPRGLANYGNMCFLNAVLQTVVHAPPIAALLSLLSQRISHYLDMQKAPFLYALWKLYRDLGGPDVHGGTIESNADRKNGPIVPETIYQALSTTGVFHGANQEDAQEFLTYFLDKIHEELITHKSSLNWILSPQEHSSGKGRSEMISASSDDWMEVGSGGRTSFARSMAHQQSPISMIIYGQYRSVIHKSRCKDSITMEPFHCIALDIKASGINTLQDAIAAMVLPEIVSSNLATVSLPDMNIGASKISYFKGKTIPSAVGINHHQHGIPFNRNSNIDLITKTTTIHQAPPILFIQLKRFDYNQITHNITKNKKTIKIPIRFDLASKAYRLHSIIYHHGGGATGGHYTSHVQVDRPFDSKATLNINHSRAFQSKWYHFNDNIISEEGGEAILDVFQNDERRSPYLLAYIAY